MPAYYAHYRFGKEVAACMSGELKKIIAKNYIQFSIGLQGPDIFFFYRPVCPNKIIKYGVKLHGISAYPFFEHALKVVKEKGRDSKEYAYLMGFICHYILDSECHPYVAEMIEKTGVRHLEIEEEFEKKLLRMDGKDPVAYPVSKLVPADAVTAKAICSFYENASAGMSAKTVQRSLRWLRLIKKLFTAPGAVKQTFINTAMKLTGQYAVYKGLMNQRTDNLKCAESNLGLQKRFDDAVSVAVRMIQSFDESLQSGTMLAKRFDRTFE